MIGQLLNEPNDHIDDHNYNPCTYNFTEIENSVTEDDAMSFS